jgi:CRISPR/Cas system-associated exonuclease Cas4 (RecB family)
VALGNCHNLAHRSDFFCSRSVHVPEVSDIVMTGLEVGLSIEVSALSGLGVIEVEVGLSTEVSAVLALSGIAVRARARGQEQDLG